MLSRFAAMKQDAKERGIKVDKNQIAILVLANVIEDQGIDLAEKLDNIDSTLSQGGL